MIQRKPKLCCWQCYTDSLNKGVLLLFYCQDVAQFVYMSSCVSHDVTDILYYLKIGSR